VGAQKAQTAQLMAGWKPAKHNEKEFSMPIKGENYV
jgi:hypothetical protein